MNSPDSVVKLNIKIDITRVQDETRQLLSLCPFHPLDNQISLNHRQDSEDPFYDGIGNFFKDQPELNIQAEAGFTEFNGVLRGWYLEQVYKTVADLAAIPFGRVRLMRLPPKGCLSMHQDAGWRIHLPIFTNAQSFLIFKEGRPVHLPADGSFYAVNTTVAHTAMNGHLTDDRIHMVFCVRSNNFSEWLDAASTRSLIAAQASPT